MMLTVLGDRSGREVLSLQHKDLSSVPNTAVEGLGVAVLVYNPRQR